MNYLVGMSIWRELSGHQTENSLIILVYLWTKTCFCCKAKTFSFWVQIYDRLQQHTANLLIPLDYFVLEEDEMLTMQTSTYVEIPSIYCIQEQISDTWINVTQSASVLSIE